MTNLRWLLPGFLGGLVSLTLLGTEIGKQTQAQSLFGQQEVPQENFAVVAAPIGSSGNHQLLIIQQVGNQRACWQERGSNPTLIDPLLLNFDFTGICGRSTDANGYSIRVDGNDLAFSYSLAVVRRPTELALIGRPIKDRQAPPLELGRTNGLTNEFAKIVLNPGWRLTKRTSAGKVLGHVYLTNDSGSQPIPTPTVPPIVLPSQPPVTPKPTVTPTVTPTVPPVTPTVPPVEIKDISQDIYRKEIEDAIGLGFAGGFPDGTFQPLAGLTREQLVSLVLEALRRLPGVNLPLPTTALGAPYPDVEQGRWSAAKIQFARDRQIISGYEDGTFRPGQVLKRSELIAVLRRAAEYGKTLRGLTPRLNQTELPLTFPDLGTHWSAALVTQMSSYCRVATPLNEQGLDFLPEKPAQRNYATAATLRMIRCVQADPS
jgi:N-acetylmuramoyl-L-alanine amidase